MKTPKKEKGPAALGGAGPGAKTKQTNHTPNDSPLQRVLSCLPDAKRNGSGWQVRCPSHDDKHPSLSISKGDNGHALIKCHAGCTTEAVAEALGLEMADLMPDRPASAPRTRRAGTVPGVSDNRNTFKSAKDAVAALEETLGKRSALWTYSDAADNPVGVVVRWNRDDGGKDIRPVSKNGDGWIIGAMPAPRPLYRLGELKNGQQFFVCEGEKAADSLVALGFVVTTSAGGSQAAAKTDWTPCAGKECLILPDHDDPGSKYADDVADLLAELSPAPSVKIIDLPGLPDGGDVFDFIAAQRAEGRTDDEIRAEIEALAKSAEKIEPIPNEAVTLTWRPFPVDALPSSLRSFVVSLSRATVTDPSMSALSVLVTCAGCIGNRVAAITRGGWVEPAVLWGATVVPSGGIKSPVFRNVKRPLTEAYKTARIAYADETRRHEADMLRYAAERVAWMAAQRKGGASDPPLEPDPPTEHRVFVSDITVEKLACVLQSNPLGLIVLRDELAAFVGAWDRYAAGGKGSDRANYLSMYDAADITVDRKSEIGTIFVERGAVSILGTIQPATLERMFGAADKESGALARFLLTSPPNKPALWTDHELTEDDCARWGDTLKGLLGIQPKPGDDGPSPRLLPIGADAKSTFIKWQDAHEWERVAVSDADLAAHFAKLKGACVRIALILECVEAVTSGRSVTNIGLDSMNRAIQIVDWFKHEARRVYSVLSETGEERVRRKQIELIRRRGSSVSVRDWQRIRSHKSAADSENELSSMIPAGQWRHVSPGPNGGRPTKVFALPDSSDTDNTTTGGPENEGIVSVSSVKAPENDPSEWGEA